MRPPLLIVEDAMPQGKSPASKAKAAKSKTTAAKKAAAKNAAAAPKLTTADQPASHGQHRRQRQVEQQHKETKNRQRRQRRRRETVAEQAVRVAEEALAAQAKMGSMPVVHSHAAGIDVGDSTHWVCVDATPDGSDRVREFSAMTHGLKEMVAWLRQCGVTTVALEATGIYSHIVFLTLLEEGVQTIMVSPQFTRQIKGRPKTDKRDCEWIQRLHKHGLLPKVFQPNEATQTLRDLVRQRANHVRLSAEHIQRMQKALELMNLKLTKVLSNIVGVTGLKIIQAIIKGERDPHKLASFRDRRCKHSVAEIVQALTGRYRAEHVLELQLCFTMWQKYQEVVKKLDGVIDAHLKQMRRQSVLPPLPPSRKRPSGNSPHEPHFDVRTALYYLCGVDLTAIEGIGEMHALVIISEIGTDLSAWPTVQHFSSWLGLCPNWKKTGGKVKSSRTRRGKNRAATALRLAAFALMNSKSYLGAYLRRQRMRLGAPKAITATAHKLARIIYNMLRFGVAYAEKTEAEYAAQVHGRRVKSLHRQARELGYELKEIAAPAVEATAKPTPANDDHEAAPSGIGWREGSAMG
jgi:transposase